MALASLTVNDDGMLQLCHELLLPVCSGSHAVPTATVSRTLRFTDEIICVFVDTKSQLNRKQITSNILKGVEKIASQHPEGNGTNQKSCETRRTEVQGNACLQPDVFRSLPAPNGVG
ncbi:hypothetical protein BD769DRAFT_1386922 [Suillus cothurnatus]|nr:hypothetical protein BD769DRAFT_1386922 [Suillus cothurnatus]